MRRLYLALRSLFVKSSWSQDALFRIKLKLKNHPLVILANREPSIQIKNKHQKAVMVRPASGLVSALEPVIREVGGIWIAQGSQRMGEDIGTANSSSGKKYSLQRVVLKEEEEQGFYLGFSNEGLWPLCHHAYNRPVFRSTDWSHYRAVNERFSQSVPEEILSRSPLILVQDYHFGLVARMLRRRPLLEKTKIGLFWHIPWSSPDVFGICPWNQEILDGMLGSDVIGFHTQEHCQNFLDTCSRHLKAEVNWNESWVRLNRHLTWVRPFPIGIDTSPVKALSFEEKQRLKKRYGVVTPWVAVGVDRLDYTKGILERMQAVELFLEKYPQYIGKFSLVQMGSPSRTQIPAYQNLITELRLRVNQINRRFSGAGVPPGYQAIVFHYGHYNWDQVKDFYQLGDLCLVTSLHDGMNLVAKEYVLCQRAEKGVLVLSKFAGASQELTEALIVNPYSIEEVAEAIAVGLTLSSAERAGRMKAMKAKIHAYSAFHWAEDFIHTLLKKEG